ncbi:hypothetical protein GGR53DRAFT_526361 [Hypoxylon sp. FL1150]|nr:hypothetical protein GGR53DRAFT_526361 [Hypoxylon sp. FL1150]
MLEAEAQSHAEDLQRFFTNENRFEFHSMVGHGYQGSICRFRYKDEARVRELVIKRAFDDGLKAVRAEKRYIDWPSSGEQAGSDETASRLAHNDLHYGNVLLGEPPNDFEHLISPILKFIDFGSTRKRIGAVGRPSGEQTNISDIGFLMVFVIHLTLTSPNSGTGTPPTIQFQNESIQTYADSLVPFPEGFDEDLLTMVCACMAADISKCPSLAYLDTEVSRSVREKTAAYYGDKLEEQDAEIVGLWHSIVYEASLE